VKEEGGLPDTPGAELPSQEVHLLQQYADTLLQVGPRACAYQLKTPLAARSSCGTCGPARKGVAKRQPTGVVGRLRQLAALDVR